MDEQVAKRAEKLRYGGFHLVVGEFDGEVWYCTNRGCAHTCGSICPQRQFHTVLSYSSSIYCIANS
jgi:hypothetical protein